MDIKKRHEELKNRIKTDDFTAYNGVYAESIEEGRAVMAVDLNVHSMNIWGIPHGGLLYTLADVAAGVATQSCFTGINKTVSGTLNFLDADVAASKLTAVGVVDRIGRTMAFCTVQIRSDNGILLAEGQFVMHLERREA